MCFYTVRVYNNGNPKIVRFTPNMQYQDITGLAWCRYYLVAFHITGYSNASYRSYTLKIISTDTILDDKYSITLAEDYSYADFNMLYAWDTANMIIYLDSNSLPDISIGLITS